MKSGIEDRVQQVRFMAHLQYVVIILPARLMAFKKRCSRDREQWEHFQKQFEWFELDSVRVSFRYYSLIHMVGRQMLLGGFFRESH